MKSKKNKVITILYIAISILLTLNGCQSSKGAKNRDLPYPKTDLNGMIYNHEGLPVPDVRITVDDTFTVTTNMNGRFTIPALSIGLHRVVASSMGYETYETEVAFKNPTEVLYISMVSARELLENAKKLLEKRLWTQADLLITRALKISPNDLKARYLSATAMATPYRQDRDFQKAKDILESLIVDGYSNSAIYLFLADIYQYDIKDIPKSIDYLAKYLGKQPDTIVERRLMALNKLE